jgi:hypothetical protein
MLPQRALDAVRGDHDVYLDVLVLLTLLSRSGWIKVESDGAVGWVRSVGGAVVVEVADVWRELFDELFEEIGTGRGRGKGSNWALPLKARAVGMEGLTDGPTRARRPCRW